MMCLIRASQAFVDQIDWGLMMEELPLIDFLIYL